MKINIEFDITDEFKKEEFERCYKSLDLALALWDIEIWISYLVNKHEGDVIGVIDVIGKINDIYDKYNIDLERIIS